MKTFLCAARLGRCILLVASAALSALFLGVWAMSAHATGLECPEIGQGVPEVTSDPARAKLLLGGAGPDLANEIGELINQVQLKEPAISNADLTNGLIAAYCPLVAQAPGLTSAQRWSQMHRFVQVQIAANDLPLGLSLSMYQCRPRSTASSGARPWPPVQTPAQFMGSILTVAAGK
jgi:hypothetical protein